MQCQWRPSGPSLRSVKLPGWPAFRKRSILVRTCQLLWCGLTEIVAEVWCTCQRACSVKESAAAV